MNITPPQLRRLQVLYGQFEAHTLDVDRGRGARLNWASQRLGRVVDSFSNISIDEGRKLIDTLQGVMNVKAPSKTPRKRMQRKQAEKAGTEGRRDQIHNETTLASAEDFAAIQNHLARLGWDQSRLDKFLLSSRSPLKGRTQIRTLGDANKVRWALKHIAPQSNGEGSSATS
jgi:hypothetical protein